MCVGGGGGERRLDSLKFLLFDRCSCIVELFIFTFRFTKSTDTGHYIIESEGKQ